MRTRFARAAVLAVAVAAMIVPGISSGLPACASATTGGEWPWDGSDLYGSRSQPLEDKISADNALGLAPSWVFSVTAAGGSGRLTTVPVVAEGCVYLQTSAASGGQLNRIFALNADTGELVWSRTLAASGGIASPHVHDGVVYVYEPTAATSAAGKGPHVLALNSQTGAEIYSGEGVCTEPGCANNAGATSPAVYFEDMVWIGITNGETDGRRVGGFAIVDAKTGALIKRTYTIPDDQAAAGFGGCAIWAAPAIDPVTKYGYVGTAQPSNWTGKESERCNAIVKFDLDKTRSTFGEIVGAMKGTADDPPYVDVDFGGSGATIFYDADGRQLVAQHQKSGWVHAAFTRHMTHAWSTPDPGIGSPVGAYTKTATDGRNLFTVGNYGGPLVSLDGSTGRPTWAHPVVSPASQGSVAFANGVVYFVDEIGVLTAVDATNGTPAFKRPLRLDGACTTNTSGGVSVARHTIYAACGPILVALELPPAA